MLATLFAISIVLVTALGLALLVKNFKNMTFILVMIPIMMVLAGSAVWTVKEIMAQPAARQAKGEFQFLEYVTDGKKIFVWIVEPGSTYPVTIEMPYDKKKHEELEKARQGKKQGKRIVGKQSDGDGFGKPGDRSAGKLEMYEFVPMTGSRQKDEGKAD